MLKICLIDDSNSTGGAQNFINKLASKFEELGHEVIILNSEDFIYGGSDVDIVYNCSDWCMQGYKYANEIKLKCKKLYLISQISFFKPFAALYIDWEHHLYNRRDKAIKSYYDGIITLNKFQAEIWKSFGYKNVHCIPNLVDTVFKDTITTAVFCAAHWNKNKPKPNVELVKDLLPKLNIEIHSLDENPSTPDKMFRPGVLYIHQSNTDVCPVTIIEAAKRGALVYINDFPGAEEVYNSLKDKYSNIYYNEDLNDVFYKYYNYDELKELLTMKYTGEAPEGKYSEIVKEINSVMNSYEPKFSDFGYECIPIKDNK